MDRRLTRRDLLKTSAAAAASLLAGAGSWQTGCAGARPPNLLCLCSDQQHWQALGSVDPFFHTPHQDALGASSVVFESAFCSAPQCSPSRSSMLTGCYPHRTKVFSNVGAEGGAPLAMQTIGGLLQAGGYHTGFFGKWHLGADPAGNRGWDEEARDGTDARTTEDGIRFLASRARAGAPFALFLMYREPHSVYRFEPGRKDVSALRIPLGASWHAETFRDKPPIQQEYMRRDGGSLMGGRPQRDWEEYRDFYRERVRQYDDRVGLILQAVRAHGLLEDTIVVSTSDHGDMDANHKLVFKGPFMYEHVIRIPNSIRVPKRFGGVAPRRVTDPMWVNVDLVPTLLDLAGLPPIECDGRSARALLTGGEEAASREYVIGQYYGKQGWINPIRMIRTRDAKLVRYLGNGEELYDLAGDPHELVNRAGDPGFAARKRELLAELERWIAEHGDPFYSLEATPPGS